MQRSIDLFPIHGNKILVHFSDAHSDNINYNKDLLQNFAFPFAGPKPAPWNLLSHGNAVIGAGGFNFLFEQAGEPAAMATLAFDIVTYGDKKHFPARGNWPWLWGRAAYASLRAISTTGCARRRASTCGSSTWWSPTALKEISSCGGFRAYMPSALIPSRRSR